MKVRGFRSARRTVCSVQNKALNSVLAVLGCALLLTARGNAQGPPNPGQFCPPGATCAPFADCMQIGTDPSVNCCAAGDDTIYGPVCCHYACIRNYYSGGCAAGTTCVSSTINGAAYNKKCNPNTGNCDAQIIPPG